MKICFLCNQIAAWGKLGGFGMNLRRLGGGLVQAGVEVHVVTPQRKGQGRIEQLDGMTIHGISWREVFWGSSIYREINADLYHTQEPNLSGVGAWRAMPNRPHLVTCMDPRDARDWWLEARHATWLRRIKLPAQWVYEDGPAVRSLVRHAQGVYVEAEFLRQKAQLHYGLKQTPGVLPKPVPIPPPPISKPVKPVCLFLGRWDPRKRPEFFLQIARQLPDYEFVMIGRAHDASYQRRIARLAQGIPNLRHVGALDPYRDADWSAWLNRAWVLVHPAVREGLATAFQEASVHEAAILAQVDPGGYTTQFGHWIAPESSVEQWAAALRNLIQSGEWQTRGHAGREYNLTHHALEYSLEQHLETYRSHLS